MTKLEVPDELLKLWYAIVEGAQILCSPEDAKHFLVAQDIDGLIVSYNAVAPDSKADYASRKLSYYVDGFKDYLVYGFRD